jgi:hypothetical protein
LWEEGFNAKEMLHVYGGSRNMANVSLMTKEVETEVRKWLRQLSKDLRAAGFDALIKRRDKCISVGGGHVEK